MQVFKLGAVVGGEVKLNSMKRIKESNVLRPSAQLSPCAGTPLVEVAAHSSDEVSGTCASLAFRTFGRASPLCSHEPRDCRPFICLILLLNARFHY